MSPPAMTPSTPTMLETVVAQAKFGFPDKVDGAANAPDGTGRVSVEFFIVGPLYDGNADTNTWYSPVLHHPPVSLGRS
eukprot:m.25009 g.25009  ORF g.25009 m.25009 type:complete len:78 (+) comp7699_c0_seq1:288-521(+)